MAMLMVMTILRMDLSYQSTCLLGNTKSNTEDDAESDEEEWMCVPSKYSLKCSHPLSPPIVLVQVGWNSMNTKLSPRPFPLFNVTTQNKHCEIKLPWKVVSEIFFLSRGWHLKTLSINWSTLYNIPRKIDPLYWIESRNYMVFWS